MKSFGEKLRYERRNLGLTQVDLANRIECSKGLIGDIERDKKKITKNMAAKLGIIFNTDPLFWLDEEKEIEKLKEQNSYSMLFDILDELKKNNIIEKPSDIRKTTVTDLILGAIELGLEIEDKKRSEK